MVLSVQYLRALAALMVVAFHLCGKLPFTKLQLNYAGIGAAGVDIFFVLSGFVMCLTTEGKEIGPLLFYKKRILRIVPLYYIMTTAVVLVIAIWPAAASIGRLTFDQAITHMLSSHGRIQVSPPNYGPSSYRDGL